MTPTLGPLPPDAPLAAEGVSGVTGVTGNTGNTALHAHTGQAHGLWHCGCCGLVSQARPDTGEARRCPRCLLALHDRKPDSLQRTWAYLLASVLLYIPANLLPVMGTASVLGQFEHTILGGIVELWHAQAYELAVIVFVASIAVPLLKMAALALLAFTAQYGLHWRQQERSALYRLLEAVGHWSMLDVFVVVSLVGMVQFGAFATVRPEVGLLAFGGVVIATMLASSSFDPRLLWPPGPAPSVKGPSLRWLGRLSLLQRLAQRRAAIHE